MNLKLCIPSIFILIVMSPSSFAQQNDFSNRVNIKCYVELIGGRDTVFYNYNVLAEDEATYEESIVGKDISSEADKVKDVIYQVKECKQVSESFTLPAAKSYEEQYQDYG